MILAFCRNKVTFALLPMVTSQRSSFLRNSYHSTACSMLESQSVRKYNACNLLSFPDRTFLNFSAPKSLDKELYVLQRCKSANLEGSGVVKCSVVPLKVIWMHNLRSVSAQRSREETIYETADFAVQLLVFVTVKGRDKCSLFRFFPSFVSYCPSDFKLW